MKLVLTSTRLFHILVAVCTLRGQAHAAAAVDRAHRARIDPSSAYEIISVSNGAYVDVTTDAQDFDHFYLVADPSNFETAWYLRDPPTGTEEKGTYTIVHFVIEYGVTVDNSTHGTNPLRLATRNNDRAPLPLQVVPAGGGEYVVKVANKDLLWTLYGDEKKIRLLPASGEKTQHWKFVETENT